jgi:hypothetical protein
MTHFRDPDHPVIERPFEYKIIEFSFVSPMDGSESYVDLGLAKGGSLRRLRFWGPQDIRITQGFPSSSGLAVLDVSSRQMDGIRVRVANFEANTGCPEFWAREVVELLPRKL